MNDKILDFLKKQTATSISCVNEVNEPYSFSCFFAFNKKENLLYYKSTASAYHSQIVRQNPKVSGTIMPDKLNKLAVKGIQFSGIVLNENDPLCVDASTHYHSRFPMALGISGIVWTIQLNQLKMTDNVLGIFKKHSWQREEMASA
jgi:hypothetical protein